LSGPKLQRRSERKSKPGSGKRWKKSKKRRGLQCRGRSCRGNIRKNKSASEEKRYIYKCEHPYSLCQVLFWVFDKIFWGTNLAANYIFNIGNLIMF